jgi:hypothetical protein
MKEWTGNDGTFLIRTSNECVINEKEKILKISTTQLKPAMGYD